VKYLLDTHTLIWAFNRSKGFPDKSKKIIEAAKSELFVSIISFWEISIKKSLGKLDIGTTTEQLFQEVQDSPIKIITLKPEHIYQVETLPFHHKDPFDRILIATAQIEKLKIIGIDEVFDKYSVTRIWD